jgi:hypothetical protein
VNMAGAAAWILAIWLLTVFSGSWAAAKAPQVAIRQLRTLALSVLLASPLGISCYLAEAWDPHSKARVSPAVLGTAVALVGAAFIRWLLVLLVLSSARQRLSIGEPVRRFLTRSAS